MRWLLLPLFIILTACGGPNELSEADEQATLDAMTALELMSNAFEGQPSESEIESPLLDAMNCFELADTEENRKRAGNVLVAMRLDYEVDEMDIIDEMNRMDCRTNLTFGEAAGLAAFALSIE